MTGVAESVSGSLIWDSGDSLETLLLVLGKTGASQVFSSTNGSQAINVGLSGVGGVSRPRVSGAGNDQESLAGFGTGSLSGDSLTGQVTYIYTPTAVPAPSTWAMTLVGFAGLGYAAVGRKGARPCRLGLSGISRRLG